MLRKLLLILSLAISANAQAWYSEPAPIADPSPIDVPKDTTPAQIDKAILTAAMLRDWTAIDRKPGVILLKYAPRDFSATVSVSYDEQHITIAYKSSENLDYNDEDDKRVIHPNYNHWVSNLAHDIRVLLEANAIK